MDAPRAERKAEPACDPLRDGAQPWRDESDDLSRGAGAAAPGQERSGDEQREGGREREREGERVVMSSKEQERRGEERREWW